VEEGTTGDSAREMKVPELAERNCQPPPAL
jgi:hypothetical protein